MSNTASAGWHLRLWLVSDMWRPLPHSGLRRVGECGVRKCGLQGGLAGSHGGEKGLLFKGVRKPLKRWKSGRCQRVEMEVVT